MSTQIVAVLAVLAVLAVVGVVAVLRHARRVARDTAGWVGDAARTSGGVPRALVAGAVITGLEWVTATRAQGWPLLAVLAGPAVVTGWTVTHRHGRASIRRRTWALLEHLVPELVRRGRVRPTDLRH